VAGDNATILAPLCINNVDGTTPISFWWNSESRTNASITDGVVYNYGYSNVRATNTTFRRMHVQHPTSTSYILVGATSYPPVDCGDNKYWRGTAPGVQWYEISGVQKTFAEWMTHCGDTTSVEEEVAYTDTDRGILTYLDHLNSDTYGTADVDDVSAAIKAALDITAYDSDWHAGKLLAWVGAGWDMDLGDNYGATPTPSGTGYRRRSALSLGLGLR
jgi:hypothetical protein